MRGLALAILGALALWRFVSAGVLGSADALFLHPSWFGEQLGPLLDIESGRAVTHIDVRQYGVVPMLVMDAALRLGHGSLDAAEVAALAVGLVSIAGAFVVLARRYPVGSEPLIVELIAWGMFAPLTLAVAGRQVDVWIVFFVALGLVQFTAAARASAFSSVSLVAATLTKLVPGALVAFVALRDRRAAVVAVGSAAALLAVGQVVYGSLLGFAYPLAILSGLPESTGQWALHHENNSLRGLFSKLAAGYRIVPAPNGESSGYVAVTSLTPIAQAISLLIIVALVAHLVTVAVRGRERAPLERKSIEFGLAVTVMLLISPHTSHEFLAVTLVPFTVLLWLFTRRHAAVRGRRVAILAIASVVLIGVFVPVSTLRPALAIAMQLTGNDALIAPNIGAYDLLGLPGLGLVLLWIVFAVLERRTRAAPALQ